MTVEEKTIDLYRGPSMCRRRFDRDSSIDSSGHVRRKNIPLSVLLSAFFSGALSNERRREEWRWSELHILLLFLPFFCSSPTSLIPSMPTMILSKYIFFSMSSIHLRQRTQQDIAPFLFFSCERDLIVH